MSDKNDDTSIIVNNNKVFWGVLCILFGILFLANYIFDINLFQMHNLWPLFILIPGLCFESIFYTTKKVPALLIPGGILSVIGMLFFFEIVTNWELSAYTWPIYIVSVVVGLFQFYLFIGKPKGLLVLISILSIVAGTSLFIIILASLIYFIQQSIIIPIVLILIGIFILFSSTKKKVKIDKEKMPNN